MAHAGHVRITLMYLPTKKDVSLTFALQDKSSLLTELVKIVLIITFKTLATSANVF